jgi:beta-glucosidase-like glycosyl hydrolase
VATVAKHFPGHGDTATDSHFGLPEVTHTRAQLEAIDLPPFRAAIAQGVDTIMTAHVVLRSVDPSGAPATMSKPILTGLLRDELGFSGAVVADYFSVAQLFSFHRVAATPGEAGALALAAGLDMELPATDYYGAPLKAEIEAGRLSLEVVDTAVRRVLAMKFELGLFEHPYVDAEAASATFQTPHSRAVARETVAKSAILLANDGVLPLAHTLRRIAVIGPGADDQRLLQGDYHYPAHLEIIYAADQQATPLENIGAGDLLPRAGGAYAPGPHYTPHVTPLAGLRLALGDGVALRYAKGCEVLGADRSGFDEAVQLAQEADVAVVVVAGKSGLQRPVTVGEGNDAVDLDLTGVQQALVDAVSDTGTPLVVVVLSGRVHTLARVAARANALIQLFPPGEEGGNGLADVLTGAVNPSGRLPVTLPRMVGQAPIYHGYRAGGDRPMFFSDYTDCSPTPLFAFGHGLSYTSFAYEQLAVRGTTTRAPVAVSFVVRNTGARAGDEVVQLYVQDQVASVARPDQLLVGFARVPLDAGQSKRVTFTVDASRLAFYDPQMRFVTEPGAFTFSVGASAADIRAKQSVELGGMVAEYRQRDVVATKVAIE